MVLGDLAVDLYRFYLRSRQCGNSLSGCAVGLKLSPCCGVEESVSDWPKERLVRRFGDLLASGRSCHHSRWELHCRPQFPSGLVEL